MKAKDEESPPDSVDALVDEWTEPDTDVQTETDADIETEAVKIDGDEKSIDQLVAEWGPEKEAVAEESDSTAEDESWDPLVDDLNALDENGAPPQRPYADVGTKHRLDALEEHANARDQQLAAYQNGRDFADHIAWAKTNLDRPDLSDSFIQTWLVDHARSHPNLNVDWDNRFQNPAQWQDTFERAINRLRNVLPDLPDNNQDKAIAMAWVRGSSTKEIPVAPVSDHKLSKLTDTEFNDYQKKLGINS